MAKAIKDFFGIPPSQDEARKHKRLKQELSQVKNVAKIIVELKERYERSKQYCICRRYKKLKSMIKTAVTQFKTEIGENEDEEEEENVRSTQKAAEIADKLKKQAEYYARMSTTQMEGDIAQFSQEIGDSKEEYERNKEKLKILKDKYEISKNWWYNPIRRYRAMKKMVKNCIKEELIPKKTDSDELDAIDTQDVRARLSEGIVTN